MVLRSSHRECVYTRLKTAVIAFGTPVARRWSSASSWRRLLGSVTVRIIGRRVDLTVRINPLTSTPPLQEGLPSGDDCPTVYI